MTPSPPPRVRYHVLLTATRPHTGVVLDSADVVGWVNGFAAALGQQHLLEDLGHAPEDTRRVQLLQIGDAQGWFTYLYPEYPDRTKDEPR